MTRVVVVPQAGVAYILLKLAEGGRELFARLGCDGEGDAEEVGWWRGFGFGVFGVLVVV